MPGAPSKYTDEFDETFDVVVAGFGFAGAASAVAAADNGASVLLAEKMPDPGGISITAGGGLRIADDADKAAAYLKATNDGRTPDDIIETFAREMTTISEWIEELAAPFDAELQYVTREGNYPYPGADTFGFVQVVDIPGFDVKRDYPWIRVRTNGPHLFRVMQMQVERRDNIEVRTGFAATRLIVGPNGDVRGISCTDKDGKVRRIKARHGVILSCGGFEADLDMQEQYWQLRPVFPAGSQGNTGDGIRMAQDVGAELWHMWHYHASHGFRHPDPEYHCGIRMKILPHWTPGMREPTVRQSWILLDQNGRRYMDESPPYAQDTGHRHMEFYDSVSMKFPRVPSWLVVDEAGRQMYPLGDPIFNDRDASLYEWSTDNLKEVENGILKKVDSIEELAAYIKTDVDVVRSELDKWNRYCEQQHDDDHGRHPATMAPIKEPPFYIGEIWPVISNTQGGPVHDIDQRILNGFGEPVPRLYEAGELGSIWGSVYIAGGNLSECFIAGRIAANHVTALDPWDA